MPIVKSIIKKGKTEQKCITLDNEEGLYVLKNGIVTHNSLFKVLANLYVSTCTSLMWAPYKYFGQSPATVFTQVFCAVSQKKSSELLFEPLLNILESSPYFVKCRTKQNMAEAEDEFLHSNKEPDHVYWTTASPTSNIEMSNGARYKLISSPGGLLGQTIIMG